MKIDSKKCGYRIIDDGIEFYCFKGNYPDLQDFESVYVTGSFNGWLSTGNSDWLMKKTSEKGKSVFVLKKPLEKIMVPGNSGFPEFKFFGLSDNSYHILGEKEDGDTTFLTNKLVLLSDEDFTEAEKLTHLPDLFKNLSEFDLNCPACRAEIANFRRVPGTKCLYRGYHPYKKSRPMLDSEPDRIRLVQEAMDVYGIKSDITLSGYESASSIAGENMPDGMLEIEKKGNRLCVNIDYNLVYFHSDAKEYEITLQKIGKFMLEHAGPFYIHCRLGSDRTGVTCGVFALLCGADWESVAEDYEKTAACGIGEYRNRKLLQYAIQKMMGKNPAELKNPGEEMKAYFVRENILKSSEIEKLVAKLNVNGRKKETDLFDFTGNHICAKKCTKQ